MVDRISTWRLWQKHEALCKDAPNSPGARKYLLLHILAALGWFQQGGREMTIVKIWRIW